MKRTRPKDLNFFDSINLSVDKVYSAKNIFWIASFYRKIGRKALVTLWPYGRAHKVFFGQFIFFSSILTLNNKPIIKKIFLWHTDILNYRNDTIEDFFGEIKIYTKYLAN
jgi:hypothetical protein